MKTEKVLSKYFVTATTEDKSLLLFNCKTSKTHKISGKYQRDFDKIMNRKPMGISSEVKAFLDERQYLVDSINEEYLDIEYQFLKIVNSRERLRLTILPTNACNFKCIYCCQDGPYTNMNDIDAIKIIKFIKRIGLEYKSIYISWFGGEPLLGIKRIEQISDELMKFSKLNKKPYLAEITTNGYLLTTETFKRLLDCKVIFYQITIDGTNETHNKNRPHCTNNNSYEQIYKNLLKIKQNFKNNYFRIILRINITPEISQQLETILSKFSQDFGDDSRFVFAVQPVRDWGGQRIQEHKDGLINELDYYSERMELFNKLKLKLWDMNFFNFGSTFCDANYKHAYIINPKGELLRCSIAEYNKEYKKVNHVGVINDVGDAILNQNDKLWRERQEKESCKECCVYPLCCRATCKLGFNITKNENTCKKYEMIQYLQLFLKNRDVREEIDEELY